MLTVNRLREFVAEAVAEIESIQVGKVVVTKDEIVTFMQEHNEEDNHLLIGIVPEHDIVGNTDALMSDNDLGFYVLAKTDISEYDHDGYLDLFANAQTAARELVAFIAASDENQTALCGLFQNLDEISFPISPIKGLAGCNGYFVGVNFRSEF